MNTFALGKITGKSRPAESISEVSEPTRLEVSLARVEVSQARLEVSLAKVEVTLARL